MPTSNSPVIEARIAGALYVLVIILGAYAELVGRQGMVVSGNPLATLQAIDAHQHVYRLAFMAEMATNILAIPITLLIWRLLTPAGPFLALIALVLGLTQNTINAMNAWTQFAPLTMLPGRPDLSAISQGELADLARLTLHWHDLGFQIGLTFFAFALLVEGWLVLRSGYFPRWLGSLYMFAGACYLFAACNYFLALHLPIYPWVLLGSFVGEASMAFWLLVVGVDAEKWYGAKTRQEEYSVTPTANIRGKW